MLLEVELGEGCLGVLALVFEGVYALGDEHGIDTGLDRCYLPGNALVEVRQAAGQSLALQAFLLLEITGA